MEAPTKLTLNTFPLIQLFQYLEFDKSKKENKAIFQAKLSELLEQNPAAIADCVQVASAFITENLDSDIVTEIIEVVFSSEYSGMHAIIKCTPEYGEVYYLDPIFGILKKGDNVNGHGETINCTTNGDVVDISHPLFGDKSYGVSNPLVANTKNPLERTVSNYFDTGNTLTARPIPVARLLTTDNKGVVFLSVSNLGLHLTLITKDLEAEGKKIVSIDVGATSSLDSFAEIITWVAGNISDDMATMLMAELTLIINKYVSIFVGLTLIFEN